ELFFETLIYLVAIFGIVITISEMFKVCRFKMFNLNKKSIDIYINNLSIEDTNKLENSIKDINIKADINIYKNL
ncbi:MAG: hypothetical protein RSF67_02470, partial [Clostridia bacterium]